MRRQNYSLAELLHGNGLGQVTRLVDIGPARAGGVVGQQRQRHDVQHGREFAVVLGHADHVQALAALDVAVGVIRTAEYPLS